MAKYITINKNGVKVKCFGFWSVGSACFISGFNSCGGELEDAWFDNDNKFSSWPDVVDHLTKWAVKEGVVIEELEAC